MDIESISHKALRKLVETGKGKGVVEQDRVIRMIQFIEDAATFDELRVPPNFGFHALSGDRDGSFAMTVTRNWRMTFTKVDDHTIGNLDLEDYH